MNFRALSALSALSAATLFAFLLPSTSALADDAPAEHWVSAWGTALQAIPQRADLPALYRAPEIGGRTVRQIVYPAIDGRHVRLRLSNVYGTAPLVIEGVQVARSVSGGAAAIRAGSSRPVTFTGKAGVTIAPGGQIDSDPIAFDVAAHQPLAVPERKHDLRSPPAFLGTVCERKHQIRDRVSRMKSSRHHRIRFGDARAHGHVRRCVADVL